MFTLCISSHHRNNVRLPKKQKLIMILGINLFVFWLYMLVLFVYLCHRSKKGCWRVSYLLSVNFGTSLFLNLFPSLN